MTAKIHHEDEENSAAAALREANRLKDVAAKSRTKAHEAVTVVEVCQHAVVKAQTTAAALEQAAKGDEAAAKEAADKARIHMELELGIISQAPKKAEPPPPAPAPSPPPP